LAARERYADYGLARDRMFKATHTAYAPWRLVNFNDQRRGRIELLNDLLGRLPVPETAPETFDFPPLRSKPLPDRTTPLP
jgi:polyphosphate kinase 2 (PPK2 family)